MGARAPVSIVAVLATGADAATWMALLLVPPGCALALGWAAHGARPPLALLKIGVVAMAAIDATFIIFGHLSDHQNAQFAAAVPAAGLPQLQLARFGGASCDFGDYELPATVPPAVVMLIMSIRRAPAADPVPG